MIYLNKLMIKLGVTVPRMARTFGVAEDTVLDWLDGIHKAPPYADHTVIGLHYEYQPYIGLPSKSEMVARLGVSSTTARNWRRAGRMPLAARIAMTTTYKQHTLTHYEGTTLIELDVNRYFKYRSYWRAQGDHKMFNKRVAPMIERGFVEVVYNQLLLTKAGKRELRRIGELQR